MWVRKYWPELGPHGTYICRHYYGVLEAMILDVVKAKGKAMADIGRYVSDSEAVWLLLDKHVGDVPEVK